MPAPFLDAAARHPLRLPDGTVHANTVHLARVIDHPNIAVGDFSYAHDFEPVTDWAARLAPYLHPGAPERLVIGRFAQVAHGVRFPHRTHATLAFSNEHAFARKCFF